MAKNLCPPPLICEICGIWRFQLDFSLIAPPCSCSTSACLGVWKILTKMSELPAE